jgi:hypothetical protein
MRIDRSPAIFSWDFAPYQFNWKNQRTDVCILHVIARTSVPPAAASHLGVTRNRAVVAHGWSHLLSSPALASDPEYGAVGYCKGDKGVPTLLPDALAVSWT